MTEAPYLPPSPARRPSCRWWWSRPGGFVCGVGAGPRRLGASFLLERGRDVDRPREDVERFRRTGVPFFPIPTCSSVKEVQGLSDGKLNTGIRDPRCRYVLEQLAAAGAPEEIALAGQASCGDRPPARNGERKGIAEPHSGAGGEVRFPIR